MVFLTQMRRAHGFVTARRSRTAIALTGAAIVLSAAVLAVRPGANAQTSGAASAAQTEEEAEAIRLYDDEQLIGARTKAEAALEANPAIGIQTGTLLTCRPPSDPVDPTVSSRSPLARPAELLAWAESLCNLTTKESIPWPSSTQSSPPSPTP